MRTALNTPLPTYSAPERSQGSPANLRSDIYSWVCSSTTC